MAPLRIGHPVGVALGLALGGSAFRMSKQQRSYVDAGLEAHMQKLQTQVQAVEASMFNTFSVIFHVGTTDTTIKSFCREVGNCKKTGHPDEGGVPFAVMVKPEAEVHWEHKGFGKCSMADGSGEPIKDYRAWNLSESEARQECANDAQCRGYSSNPVHSILWLSGPLITKSSSSWPAAPCIAKAEQATGFWDMRSSNFSSYIAAVEPDMNVVPMPAMGSGRNRPETDRTWHLKAVNAPGINKRYTGRGAHVYVIDSGVRISHQEFGGRAFAALEVFNGEIKVCEPEDKNCAADEDGHGTHVAGLVAGATFGVAPEAVIWACRPGDLDFGDNVKMSDIFDTIDYISQPEHRKIQTPSIMTMSLGQVIDSAGMMGAETAINTAADRGIIVIVAAGNGDKDNLLAPSIGIDTQNRIFGAQEKALVVGSVNASNHRSEFSNFGPTVDIFAPGEGIWSAGIANDTDERPFDGTSQAAPIVAGAAAIYLQIWKSWADKPANIIRQIKAIAQNSGKKVEDARSTTEYRTDAGLSRSASKMLRLPDAPPFHLAPGKDTCTVAEAEKFRKVCKGVARQLLFDAAARNGSEFSFTHFEVKFKKIKTNRNQRPGKPRGCSVRTDSDGDPRVYYNTDKKARNDGGYALVCEGEGA